MIIKTLIENSVFGTGLIAEHGLSLYIEQNDKKIIFDTGQGENFLNNAKTLGIDISGIDAVIISHGHYDHAGGLEAFCRANSKAKIYVNKGFFVPKYKNKERFIGINYNESLFGKRISFIDETEEIYSNIFIVPEIKIFNDWDTHFKGMFTKENEEFRPDEFLDELFLAIKEKEKLNIISGCSHRGITNIIFTTIEKFKLPVNLVVGGFHTKDADEKTGKKIIDELKKLDVGMLGCCHCTGIENYARIKEVFKEKAFYNTTGNEIFS